MSALSVALPPGRIFATAIGRCPECGAPASLAALVVAQGRGVERCPDCDARRREVWPLMEIATAAVFALLAWRFGWGWPLAVYALLAALLVLVAFIDVRHRLILDVVTVPAIGASLPLAFFTVGLSKALLGGLLAGGVFLGFHLLARLIYRARSALGLGDVKLALLIGLVVGAPAALSVVLYSALAGGLMALGWLAAGRSRADAMPYGPNLALGALATILVDSTVWH